MPSEVDLLAEFSGTVRLFPLPNLVFFPHVVQGLHIFEPRYRTLTEDVLDDDLFLALVLLQDGWEPNYDGRPPIEGVACLGRIAAHEKLNDGRYNLRVNGLARLRLVGELETDRPYRIAEAEIMTDTTPASLDELKRLRHALSEAVLPRFPEDGPARGQLGELFKSETPLGALCDMLSYALPLPLDLKQQLLAETDVAIRADVLADALIVKSAVRDRKFPPDFSMN